MPIERVELRDDHRGIPETKYYNSFANEYFVDGIGWLDNATYDHEQKMSVLSAKDFYAKVTQINIPYVLRTDNDIKNKTKKKQKYSYYDGISRAVGIYDELIRKGKQQNLYLLWKARKSENEWLISDDEHVEANRLNADVRVALEEYNIFLSDVDLETDIANTDLFDDLKRFYKLTDKDMAVYFEIKNEYCSDIEETYVLFSDWIVPFEKNEWNESEYVYSSPKAESRLNLSRRELSYKIASVVDAFYLGDYDKSRGKYVYSFYGVWAKPVIYLYPKEETEIRVAVDFKYGGELTCTYPEYNNGWKVTAMPDGTLYDEKGDEYYCLYWEGEGKAVYDNSKGFSLWQTVYSRKIDLQFR